MKRQKMENMITVAGLETILFYLSFVFAPCVLLSLELRNSGLHSDVYGVHYQSLVLILKTTED